MRLSSVSYLPGFVEIGLGVAREPDKRQDERTIPAPPRRFRLARHQPLRVQERTGLEGLVRRVPVKFAQYAELHVASGKRPQSGRRLTIDPDRLVQVAHGRQVFDESELSEPIVNFGGRESAGAERIWLPAHADRL